MPAGVFLCPQRAAGILRRNRIRLLPSAQKSCCGKTALLISDGSFPLKNVRPTRRLSPFPSCAARTPAEKSFFPEAKPAAREHRLAPLAETNAPAEHLQNRHRSDGPSLRRRTCPAAAQNTCRKRHPQGTSASFSPQNWQRQHQKIFMMQ